MSWWIQDYDETQIFITDQWREWFVPKFRLHMVVDEPVINLYWTDTELGDGGITRTLTIDYRDVVDFYGGYLSNPSSAAQLGETLEAYIISAWQNLQNQINGMGGIVVNNDYLSYIDPNLDFSTRSKASIDHFLFLHKI